MKKGWRVFYPWLIYEGVMAVAGLLMTIVAFLLSASDALNRFSLLATGIAGILMIPISLYFIRQDELRRNPQDGFRGTMRVTEILWMLALGASLSYAVNFLLSVLHLFELFPSYSEGTGEVVLRGSFFLSVVVTVIIAPVTEELIMRGLVYRRLRDYIGVRGAIVGSAVLFGIFHGNMLQFIYASLLGLVLAWFMEYFHTILAPILLHISANLWSLLLSRYGRMLAGTAGGFLLGGIIMLQFLVIIFSILYLIRQGNRRKIV